MNASPFHIILRGGFFIRYIYFAIIILLIAYIVKVDLDTGAITYTDLLETKACTNTLEVEMVRVKVQQGDSIYSLFAQTSSPIEIPFIDRLTEFYKMNPHLRNQTLQIGDFIYIPIKKIGNTSC